MDKVLSFLVRIITATEKAISIEFLAEQYLIEIIGISNDSVDFTINLEKVINKIRKSICKINERYEKDALELPFIIKGTSNNLVSKGITLDNLRSLICIEEDPHTFAERIGREILRKIGCPEDKIIITPRTRDDGIDYWGEIPFNSIISCPIHKLLIIGQVKQHSGAVPVNELREFVGAVRTAFASKLFGESYGYHRSYILQFITTGEISEAGSKVALFNGIHIITKRHLHEMGIMIK